MHLLTGHSCTLEKKGGVETREKNRPQKNFGEKKISKKALLDAQYDFDAFDARMTVTPPTGGGRQKSHPKRRSTGGTPSRRRAKVHEQRKAQRDDDDDDLLERIARKDYENKGTPLLPT